jgi:hypothetical protein
MEDDQQAGWYPHPDDPARNRYWTGTEWIDSAPTASAPTSSPSSITPGKLVAILVGVVGLVAALALALVPMDADGYECGSLLSKKDFESSGTFSSSTFGQALDEVSYDSACDDARGSRLALVGTVGVVGLIVLGITVWSATTGSTTAISGNDWV